MHWMRSSPYGFKHNEQSVRTVRYSGRDGEGLNLTWEVRDGILNHQTDNMPSTLEGKDCEAVRQDRLYLS